MINANNIKYQAAAAANVVITTKPAILERILIGADVGSAVIEISDSIDDGDGNILIKLTGSTLMTANAGALEVGAVFAKGITADIVNQTDVTFVWKETA